MQAACRQVPNPQLEESRDKRDNLDGGGANHRRELRHRILLSHAAHRGKEPVCRRWRHSVPKWEGLDKQGPADAQCTAVSAVPRKFPPPSRSRKVTAVSTLHASIGADVRLMQLHGLRHLPHPHVQELHDERERHREVDVAARYVNVERLGDKQHADQDQER